MKNIFLALVILIVSTSCANLHIEKRRYNRGFHVGFTKKYQSKKEVKEKEALSFDPIDAFTPETIGNELILVSHQPIVDSIQVSTETQPLVSAEMPMETVVKSNQSRLSNQADRKANTKSDRVQKTRRFVTPRAIENKTTRHWGSNIKKLSSAESRGSGDVDWDVWLPILIGAAVIGLITAIILFAGPLTGYILMAILGVILATVFVWIMVEFFSWCMSIFDYF